MKKLKLFCVLVCSLFTFSCEEKISEDDLNSYKSMMDVRLGHLGNAIIIQGRLSVSYTHLTLPTTPYV